MPEPREHLWFSLPVRCWCGEQHVLGVDNVDEDFPEDDPNYPPSLDERLNGDDDDIEEGRAP
jgi:hypothetical protein